MVDKGIWYNPYVRIYSLGVTERLAEISCSPRVKRDRARHVYEQDEFFEVLPEHVELPDNVFRQADGKEKGVGETANRKGTLLPGALPRWIPEEVQPEVPDASEYVYPIVTEAFLGELVRLEIDNAWVDLDSQLTYLTKPELAALLTQLADGEVKLPYKGILNIQYRRFIR